MLWFYLRLFALFCVNPKWVSLAFPCLRACPSHTCNTQWGFSWQISSLCKSSSAKFCSALFLHHPFAYLLHASSDSQCYGCFCGDNQHSFLPALGTLLFLCSSYPSSAAFSDWWLSLLTWTWRAAKQYHCGFCWVPFSSAQEIPLTVLPTLLGWNTEELEGCS